MSETQTEALARLEQENATLREALEWYADIRHYDEETGSPGKLVGGGWAGTEPQEADWDADYGERARTVLGLPNPWDWPDHIKINFVARCPACGDIAAAHYADGCQILNCTCRGDWLFMAAQVATDWPTTT